MKKIFNIGVLVTFASLLIFSCAPQEFDDYKLGNTPTESELGFSITPTSNPNIVEFVNSSSRTGIASWSLGNGNSIKGDTVKGVYPSKGSYEVKLTLVTDGGSVSISKPIAIAQDDYSLLEPELEALVRDSEGKKWVFAGTGSDGGQWYYMANGANWQEVWWNAGGDCCPPPDVNGVMHFDIVGGNNYWYYSSPDAEPVKGSFSMNVKDKILSLTGAPILGDISHEAVQAGSADGRYEVKSITEDELILFVSSNGYDTGWVFKFVPQAEE